MIFTVHQLTTGIQNLLGTVYSEVEVCGEITNLSISSSGHCYFTLKDDRAQLSAVLWNRNRSPLDDMRNGLEVVCTGRIDVYPPRGSYQIVVSSIEHKGLGALEKLFVQLKRKLHEEGLFDSSHKKPIPSWIRRVGVVTSPDGAAIHDFLQVLRRRWSQVDVCIFPSPVQGNGAARQLAEGVRFFNRVATTLGIDCIILTRGGGSMEDLWEFNDESLIRTIYESELPVVSAVGHEIDVTLCDLVADRRALTPSEAAELVSPDALDWKERLNSRKKRLNLALRSRFSASFDQLRALENRTCFQFPYRKIEEASQRVDFLEERLNQGARISLERGEKRVAQAAAQLEALSPLACLARGFSLTRVRHTGQVVKNVVQLKPGDELSTLFACGEVASVVREIILNNIDEKRSC
ncbi:MAG: exodeoxyribonuclease VII large subunit [Planctomycetia bacterium]|nr:exodeoxyribonuclease VII large subunit [Planctomycetia bacterium]